MATREEFLAAYAALQFRRERVTVYQALGSAFALLEEAARLLAEPAIGVDVDHATGLEAVYDDAYAVWEVARTRLVALLEAKIGAYVAECYPQADELTVEGADDVEGFFIRAQRVTVGGQLIDGYRSNGESSSDAWDDCVEDLDSTLLDFLAGLTGEDYRGTHSIPVPGTWA